MLFYNFIVSTIPVKMFNNSEINSYITDFTTKYFSIINKFSKNSTLTKANNDLDKELKSLTDDLAKKFNDVAKKKIDQ